MYVFQKGSCLKADRCTFSHDPNIPVYVPKGKLKENVRDRILLVLLPPLGGVGETPREDVTPLEVVRHFAEAAEGDQ